MPWLQRKRLFEVGQRDPSVSVRRSSADLLRYWWKKEEFARLATLEMGKRIAESRGEVALAASITQYFADNAEAFLAPKKLKSVVGDAISSIRHWVFF